jgi:hypothetical protein
VEPVFPVGLEGLFASNQPRFQLRGGLAHSIIDLFGVYSSRRVGFTMPKGPFLLLPEPHLLFSGFTLGLVGYRGGPGHKSLLHFTPLSSSLILLLTPHDEDTEVGF